MLEFIYKVYVVIMINTKWPNTVKIQTTILMMIVLLEHLIDIISSVQSIS